MNLAIFQSAGDMLTPDARLKQLENAIRAQNVDLVLCPELFMSGYNIGDAFRDCAEPSDGPFQAKVAALAIRHNIAIAYGYPEASDGLIYNSLQLVGRTGERLANHRKRVPAPHSFEEDVFACGSTATSVTFEDVRIGLCICYEIEFPEAARQAALDGVELLLAPTALSRDWAVVAEKMIPTRALENGLWLAYANHAGSENGLHYLGGSRIVAPDGSEMAVAGAEPGLICARIDTSEVVRLRERLPYLRDADRLR